MCILIADDNASIRKSVLEHLQANNIHWHSEIIEVTEYHQFLPAEDLARKIMCEFAREQPTVILDLNLGQTTTDGLRTVECLRECFFGAYVIHSDTYFEEDVREQANKLGVRFGVRKHSPKLAQVVRAAQGVALVRSQMARAVWDQLGSDPILPYKQPTPLRQLLQRLFTMGYQFDGSEESVDWEEAKVLQAEVRAHFESASEAYGKLRSERSGAFGGTTSVPVFVPDWSSLCRGFLGSMVMYLQRTVDEAREFIDN